MGRRRDTSPAALLIKTECYLDEAGWVFERTWITRKDHSQSGFSWVSRMSSSRVLTQDRIEDAARNLGLPSRADVSLLEVWECGTAQ